MTWVNSPDDIGGALRHTREHRGIALDTVAAVTRIPLSTLRAIERNDVDRIPGGIFLRGFLKAYAREVGLDPEDVAKRYFAQIEPVPEPGELPPPPLDDEVHAEEAVLSPDVSTRMVSLSVALAVGLLAYLTMRSPDTTPIVPAALPAPIAAVAAPETPVGTSGSVDARPAAAVDMVRVEITATGECWVSVTADGAIVVYRLMQAGESQTIEARESIVLRVGEPRAFTYRINGAPGRPLGPAGEPATIEITPENSAEFAVGRV